MRQEPGSQILPIAVGALATSLLCVSGSGATAPRTLVPTVRAGERFQTAPVSLGRSFKLPVDSKVREKGQYIFEFEGLGARDRIRLTIRRLDKPGAPASVLLGTNAWTLKCSVGNGPASSDNPRGIIEPEDNPRGIIQPADRPRTFVELGFRPNGVASVHWLGQSVAVEIVGSPRQDGGQCVMRVSLEAAK
jgi:hypothetical protein